jgi:hypothetical protein
VVFALNRRCLGRCLISAELGSQVGSAEWLARSVPLRNELRRRNTTPGSDESIRTLLHPPSVYKSSYFIRARLDYNYITNTC